MHTVDQLVDIVDFSQLRMRINVSVKCQSRRFTYVLSLVLLVIDLLANVVFYLVSHNERISLRYYTVWYTSAPVDP